MALNDTFKILPKNKISLKADLSPLLPNKDYWAEECKEHPSKKECLFYCGLYFFISRLDYHRMDYI